MDSIKNLLVNHMTKLCNVIGPRPTGSDTNKVAVQYSAETFKDLGFKVNLQEFTCMDWENEGAYLTVDGQSVEVTASEYSLPCNVNGELECVSTIEELKTVKLHNKICVMYGDLCKEPLMPKSMIFWNPKEHQEIIRELEIKKPLAVITISHLPDVPVSIIEDGDFEIPCAKVMGKYLDVMLNSKGNATLKLMTKRTPSSGTNVIATLGQNNKKICFSAHIDTKPNTSGALDNSSGVAVLLALASKVAKTKYPYEIEFVLFNGEDYYSNPGEIAFMKSYLQSPQNYIYAFNVDGVGMKECNTSYSFYECPKDLQKRINNLSSTFQNIEEIDPWPMGDHMIFAISSIPSIAVTASKIFTLMDSVLHTSKDNLSLIDMDELENVVEFLFCCISNN